MNYLRNFDEWSDKELEDVFAEADKIVNDGMAADVPNEGREKAALPTRHRIRKVCQRQIIYARNRILSDCWWITVYWCDVIELIMVCLLVRRLRRKSWTSNRWLGASMLECNIKMEWLIVLYEQWWNELELCLYISVDESHVFCTYPYHDKSECYLSW